MSKVDLSGELFGAQGALTAEHRLALLAAGVAHEAIDWGWAGVARILIERALYQPVDGGSICFIAPVRVADPNSPEASDPNEVIRWGELVDLVAFPLDRPENWVLRTGAAVWLGAIGPQYLEPPPVLVHRTPLEWLQAGGNGLVPLCRDARDLRSLLLPCRSIAVTDPLFGKRIKHSLERPLPIPPIFILVDDGKRAA